MHSELIFKNLKSTEIPDELVREDFEIDISQINEIAKDLVELVLKNSINEISNQNYLNKQSESESNLEKLSNFTEDGSENEINITDEEDDDLELFFEDESFQ